jgi:TPR repeat protein
MSGHGKRAGSLRGLILAAACGLLVSAGPAQADLATGLKAYAAGDYQTALDEFLPLAEQGDADAQFKLGVIYDSGKGVAQDAAEAVRWNRLAAEQGNSLGQANLGRM